MSDTLYGKTDWAAYRAAERAAGNICTICGAYIVFGRGAPDTCHECKQLGNMGAPVDHSRLLRCPSCTHAWKPAEVYADGEHDVSCPSCQYLFTIETHVEYSFTSPASGDTD
jgi:uncharacterized C2H2 Zn-finger protein